MGWLSWVDDIYLILTTTSGSAGGLLCLHEWSIDKEQLDRRLLFLEDVMKQPEIKPFEPALRTVLQRCVLEMGLKKTYPEQVESRYRDFHTSGRPLNFGAKYLESDLSSGLLVNNGLSE